jgi:hypothetical protein
MQEFELKEKLKREAELSQQPQQFVHHLSFDEQLKLAEKVTSI